MTAMVSDSATFCKRQSLTALPSIFRAVLRAPLRARLLQHCSTCCNGSSDQKKARACTGQCCRPQSSEHGFCGTMLLSTQSSFRFFPFISFPSFPLPFMLPFLFLLLSFPSPFPFLSAPVPSASFLPCPFFVLCFPVLFSFFPCSCPVPSFPFAFPLSFLAGQSWRNLDVFQSRLQPVSLPPFSQPPYQPQAGLIGT